MVIFIFIQILIGHSVSYSENPDQMPHYVTSDLGLHCLPICHSKEYLFLKVQQKKIELKVLIILLYLKQNVCCGYSRELSQ